MCGISGIIYRNRADINNIEIVKMNNMITHRGPDGCNYYLGYNLALGHTRLAILDLSEDGNQPMKYLDNIISYNGEIYNYLELRQELAESGYIFKSETDTEVILASYDKWGQDCVNHFNGMWAFVLYDKANNILFCSRDRFGVKPFYYTTIKDKFLFGSEIKQFTIIDGWAAKVNYNRVHDFLLFGVFDHTDETFFQGVYQLRGGYNLIYDLNSHTFNVYQWYNLIGKIKDTEISFEKACSSFRQLLEDSIKLRLRSDVKVGSCLSGGLDSSSIVCLAKRILQQYRVNQNQETVSSCFHIKKYDEQEYIDEVVDKTKVISHKVFPKYEDLFNELDKIVWYQDEPFGSTSIFAQWNVFKTAKDNNLTVMLDGQGADELLGGYSNFYYIYLFSLIKTLKINSLKREIAFSRRFYANSSMYISKIIIKELVKVILPSYLYASIKNVYRNRKYNWIKPYNSNYIRLKYRSIRDMSLDELIFTSLPMLLHYEDRDSMAFSIESRVPFLDYRLVEFVISLPDEYKMKYSKSKYIMRESLKGILPDKIANRLNKLGFVTPEDVWIKENSEQFRLEIAKACKYLKNFVDEEKVLKWFDDLIKNDKTIDFTVWRIVCLGRWAKVFNVEM